MDGSSRVVIRRLSSHETIVLKPLLSAALRHLGLTEAVNGFIDKIDDCRYAASLLSRRCLHRVGLLPSVSRHAPMRASVFLRAARELPFASFDELTGGRGLVVIAPHADDESLGCGGLIAEACARDRPVRVVVVTDGTKSHPNSRSYPAHRLCVLREAETLSAVEALGLDRRHVSFLRLPDGSAPRSGPEVDKAAEHIAAVATACDAGALFATWPEDPHPDHQASYAIARRVQGSLERIKLHAYPVTGWMLPRNRVLPGPPQGTRLDIARHRAAKRRAIRAHASQVTNLIDDDPKGFRLDARALSHYDHPFETFLEVTSWRADL